jgi:hypothetical protein
MSFNFLYAKDWIWNCGRSVVTLLYYGFKEARKGDFEALEKKVVEWGEPSVPSGKQVSWTTV